MVNRLKVFFFTFVILMIINCSSVFATNTVSKEVIDLILKTYGCSSVIGKDGYNDMLSELQSANNYKFVHVSRTGEIHVWISTNPFYTEDGGKITGLVNGGYYNIVHNSNLPGYIAKVNITNKNNTVSPNNPRLYFYAPNGVYKTNSTEFYYGENYESSELINELLKPKTPWFEYSQSLITDYVKIENEYVNRKFDAFSLDFITNNHALGSLYTRLNKEILQIYILKLDLYGNYVIDYKRMLYDQESYVNGNWSGYLKMSEVGENYDRYLVYYPQSFMQPNYIYSLRIQLEDGSFLDDIGQFMIINTAGDTSEGLIIGSGDSDSIITDQENNQGDITGSINDLNNTIGNLGNTINDTILGEENESGDRVGGLLGGILDGIKGFFIPEDNYFSNYFTELNDWFSARLGLLYFPFDLLFDFFDRVTSIDFNDQTLSIGPYKMPLNDDFELVPELEFDFKTFVENEDIKGVYDTYLIIVDGLIIFGLSQLIRIKYEEVFGK